MIIHICLALFFTATSSNAEDIELTIKNGPILGRTDYTSGLGKLWYIFQGIPFAEPPERFELAKEKAPWTDVINCTYDKPECVQDSDPVSGSEDCLTLSVYSPSLNGSYPVFVWIHGGAFVTGNGSYSSQAPDLIVEEGIVFVQIQYRLGIFGFMSTEDLVCPGNLGFKDQLLALQWVQKNIKYFGGDPNQVTLGGQSAGSASAALHLHSPKSAGLFHAMVLNSGVPLCPWSLNRRAKKTAFNVGASLGVITFHSRKLVDGLKKKNYIELQKASTIVSTLITLENPMAGISYGYVPEPDHPDAFFRGKSEQLLSQGNFTKVPVLLGFTSNEALLFSNISWYIQIYLSSYDLDPHRLAPVDLTDNFFKSYAAGVEIKKRFFKFGIITGQDNSTYKFISSDQFERPIGKFALDVSKYVGDTYVYQFNYTGRLGGPLYRTQDGVGHGEDLKYLFPRDTKNSLPTDLLTSQRTVRLWSNFVKAHNPTPVADPLLENKTWLPVRANSNTGLYNYFNIDSSLEPLTNPKNDNMQFWMNDINGIYKKYGQGIYDTY